MASLPSFHPFESEEARALANLRTYYEQWVAAARVLETRLKGSLRWKTVAGKQYLYHRVSSNPLIDNSLGARNAQSEAHMLRFTREKAETRMRHDRARAESARFARILAALGASMVDRQAAAVLRHLDLKEMLGGLLLVVGTNAMAAYETLAGGRIFRGYDATQDFDLTWRGAGPLQLAAGVREGGPPATLLTTLREVDKLYTVNTERPFQATTGKYEVEFLAAPSTIRSFPFAKDDIAPLGDLREQEWLMLGTPLRQIVAAADGSPAPVAAPDPRWMALHKLWLSQKPKRAALKKPKDEAQGLLLLRAVIETMPGYPLDEAFIAQVEEELRPYLHMGVKWARENPSGAEVEGGDAFARPLEVDADAWKKIRRFDLREPAYVKYEAKPARKARRG
ncbi:MAG TPA: GSU2403 family nucleotidyltransferase fold protein [Burkholderiales bacterium]|jgi:hypothetical protein